MGTRIVGLALFLLTLVVFMLAGGSPERFFNLPSLVIVIFGSTALTLMKYKRGDGSQKVLRNLRKYVILSSLLAILINIMEILFFIEAPEATLCLVGAALTAPLYGLILYCIIDTFID